MKRILILSLILLSACSLSPEGIPMAKSAHLKSLSSDYTANIYDDWAVNRGLRLTSNTSLNKWEGLINKRLITHTGTTTGLPSVPSGGVLATTSMGFTTETAFPLTGAFTFCWYGRKQSATSGDVTIFDTNTAVPRAKIMLRSSATDHIILSYNGVIKDTGVQFPYGSLFHTLIVRCDGTNAAVFLDGSQIGASFTVTGGGLNTTQKVFILTSSTGTGLFGETKRIRIYKESLSDSLVSVVNTGDFVNHIVDTGDSRFLVFAGQSNVGCCYTGIWVRANYPSYLQGELNDPWIWDYTTASTNSSFINIPGTVSSFFTSSSYPINMGPFLNAGYQLKQAYPNDHVYILESYKGATDLYSDWAPGNPSGLRATMLARAQNALATLIAEERNLVSINFIWIQGENDCNTTMEPSYLDNLNSLDADVRAVLGSNTRFIEVYLASNSVSRSVQVGQDLWGDQTEFVSQDTLRRFGVVTDGLPFNGASPHYTPVGYDSIGYKIAPLTY